MGDILAEGNNALCAALRDPETTPEEIRSIVSGNPRLLGQRDRLGFLPLHVAVIRGLAPDVVRYLVAQRPDSVREPTRDGRGRTNNYPIRLAFDRGFDGLDGEARLENVRVLVEAWPESLEEARGRGGNTALHVAFRCRLPFEMVRFLVEQHPPSVRARDNKGYLPLLKALLCGDDVVRFLVEQYPEAVQAKAHDGTFALQAAIHYRTPARILKFSSF
jgi:ankyrin repeat protein